MSFTYHLLLQLLFSMVFVLCLLTSLWALDTPLLDFLVELQVLCVSTTALLYARTTLRFCRCFALFQSPKGLTVVVTTKSLRSSNSNTAADAKTRCAEFHVSPLTSKKTAPWSSPSTSINKMLFWYCTKSILGVVSHLVGIGRCERTMPPLWFLVL